MPQSDAERIATVEEAVRDLRGAVADIRQAAREDHHRLRDVEAAVALILEAHKDARRAEETQYRRLEMRIQWLTAVVGLAALAGSLIVAFVHG